LCGNFRRGFGRVQAFILLPTYRKHKVSGQAIVTLTDGLGGRRDVLLGKYGTKESRQAYARVIAEWEAAGRHLPGSTADLTVNELLLRYWREEATKRYRKPDGSESTQLGNVRQALKPVKALYGPTPAAEFTPLRLKAVRQEMVAAGLCRGTVNDRVQTVRRVFKWAVENELLPPSVSHGLQAVAGLRKGSGDARESLPVRPVARSVVEATLPYLPSVLADMVSLQMETGMRSGELCILRACDLDTGGKVWLYRPESHKTAHHGYQRSIAIGPKGQAILRRHLKPNIEAYLFSPAESVERQNRDKRAGRKTPLWPSHQRHQEERRRRRKRRALGDRYDSRAYAHAIRRACERAFPPEPLARRDKETYKEWMSRLTAEQKAELAAWRKAHRWHPHQLRHLRATELRREFGLDVARAVLGHRTPIVTEIYAEIDTAKAVEAMSRIG
jgi:integrase